MAESWLNRNVVAMGSASLLADWCYEAAIPLLPAFLVLLGLTPASAAAALGVIEGAADATASFLKLGSGFWSDRLGQRRPLAMLGYAITALATGGLALATSWWGVLAARVLAWTGKGVRGPARDALLSESVEAPCLGRAFGLRQTMDTIGAVLGPLSAFALLGVLPIRAIFALTLVPGLLSAACFLLVEEPPHAARSVGKGFRASLRDLPAGFRALLAGVALFGFGNFSATLLVLRATQVLGGGRPGAGWLAGAAAAIGLYTLHNVAGALASYPAGHLGDRLGKRPLLASGYALFGFAALGAAFPRPDLAWFAGIFILSGLSSGFVGALEGSLAAERLGNHQRATGFGVLASVNGAGDLASSVLVGMLWAQTEAAWGFVAAAMLTFAGAIALLAARVPSPPSAPGLPLEVT